MTKGRCMSNIKSIWFMRRRSSKIHQILQLFAPYWAPKWGQRLDFRKIEIPFPKDASYQIWFKSVQWFWRGSIL